VAESQLVILGGGPAGYSAALRAAEAGARPILIERGRVGGTCLHAGCIPTKTMLAGAEALLRARRGPGFGFETDGLRLSLAGLHQRKRAVVDLLATSLEASLRAKAITILTGEARLTAPDRVEVRSGGSVDTLTAKAVVIATGSKPKMLPGIAPVPGRIVTSDDLVAMESWPGSMLIVGGGVVGVEFASLLTAFGVKVTILEALPSLLPGEDAELGRRLGQALTAAGVAVMVGSGLASLTAGPTGIEAVTAGGAVVKAEAALMAIGRTPALDGVDAVALGLATERGGLAVDGRMTAGLPHVFAAGDVTGKLLLAHFAAAQGRIAGAAALGQTEALDLDTVPRCVYSIPEVAAVGLTEEQAKSRNLKVRKGKTIFRGNGRAQSMGEGEGFIKVLAEEATGRIVGVMAIGHLVSELIDTATLAVSLRLTARQITTVIHAHPTLSEAFAEACAQLG